MLRALVMFGVFLFPGVALAAEATKGQTGRGMVYALWLLANFSFAGMRAQDSSNTFGRVVCFFLGFPGTLLTVVFVREGGHRVYGVELPKAAPAQANPPEAGS